MSKIGNYVDVNWSMSGYSDYIPSDGYTQGSLSGGNTSNVYVNGKLASRNGSTISASHCSGVTVT